MSVPQQSAIVTHGISAQHRHMFADGLIAPARQDDPSLLERWQSGLTLPDEKAPCYMIDLISEPPPEPTDHTPGNLMDHPVAPSRSLPVSIIVRNQAK